MRIRTLDLGDLTVDSFSTAAISASTPTVPMTDTGGGDTRPDGPCSGVICTYTCPLTGTN